MTVSDRQKKREAQEHHDRTVARAEADKAARIPVFPSDRGNPPTTEVIDPPGSAGLDTAPPPDQAMEDARATADQTPEGRAVLLKTEILRRKAAQQKAEHIAGLKREIEARKAEAFEGQILTDAIPTGVTRIDKAGQAVTRSSGSGNLPSYQEQLPTLDHLPPEHPDRISADRAADGVELRRGIPFAGRVKMALELGTPGVQKQVVKEIIQDIAAKSPAGAPYMRVDPSTGGVEFLRQITKEDEGVYEAEGSAGKFRWVSAESAGITADSLGAIFDLAELGSITGGVVGAVATRNLTFFKNAGEAARGATALSRTQRIGRGTGGLAGEGGLGLVGREVGNLIELAISAAQGREIDNDEVWRMFQSDIGREAAAAVIGRGASKSLDMFKEATAVAGATFRGNHIITNDKAAAREATENSRLASEDTAALNRQLEEAGKDERITVTRAEGETATRDDLVTEGPSGQAQRLADEADRLVSQGEGAATAQRNTEVATRTAHRMIAEDFGSDLANNFSAKTANDVLRATEQMPLRAVPGDASRGYIAPSNMKYVEGGTAENGLVFQVMPDNSLQIVSARLPEGLQGIGLGSDMYRSYLALGVKEGRVPKSGGVVENAADKVWLKMKDEGWDVSRHPQAWQDPATKAWQVKGADGNIIPGESVWKLNTETPFTRDIVKSIDELTRTASGKIAKGDQFERFLFTAEATELAAVKAEVAQNTLLKADMAEALLKNYEKHVLVPGKDGKVRMSAAAREQWFDDASRVLSTVFTPSERLALRQADNPMLFRTTVEDMIENKGVLATRYGTVLSASSTKGFRDNGKMLKHIRELKDAGSKKRVWNIMRENAPEQFEAMKGLLRQEVRDQAYKPVKAKNVSRHQQQTFGRYLNENRQLLTEVLGEEYVNNLTRFNRSIARQTVRQGIDGVKRVINPPMLMAARTVMGVMNKWQRRVTAARRFQMQKWYGRTLDIVSDPEKMTKFMSLQDLQLRLGPNDKAVVAGVIRLGLVDTEEEWREFNNFAKQWVGQIHDDYLSEHKDPADQTRKAEKDRVERGQIARPQSFELPQ